MLANRVGEAVRDLSGDLGHPSASVVTRTDRAKWAFAVAAVTAVVAGCGGSHRSDTAAIRAVLAASPKTYLHYGARTWGVQPRVRAQVRIASDRATAVLSAPRTIPQRVTLHQHNGVWRIAKADQGIINGPRAERAATSTELAAISADERRRDREAGGYYRRAVTCITYAAHISTLNPHFARVDHVYPKSALDNLRDKCAKFVGNGEEAYVQRAAGWHYVGGESDGFPCDYLPPGVVRSLFGSCWTFK